MTGRAGRACPEQRREGWFGGRLTAALASGRTLAALLFLPAIPVLPAVAQTIRAEGKVLEPDSTPVAGARVVLHRVGRTVQGPLDSVRTDRRGRFRFRFRPDTTSIYLLSARHAGIEYFSPPVHTNPARPDTSLRILAYDTSSTAPISLEARHVILARPGEDGSRRVLDMLILRNDGQRTRVASDGSQPSWIGLLPGGTTGLEVGESDVSPDAVTRRGDSLIITAPLAPGEKQITVEYGVPPGHGDLEFPFPQPLEMVNLLAEEKTVSVRGGTVVLADSQTLQGRTFHRWTGSVPAGGTLRVELPSWKRAPEWLLTALVAGVVLVLAGAGWYILVQQKNLPKASSNQLLDAVAALDARYLGRESETSAEEWQRYRTERARLKAQFETSLAAGSRSP